MSERQSDGNKASQDAYRLLGLEPGASFEEVQDAKNKRIQEIGDDPILKAKLESSYDILLMESLKARQLGNVSNAAMSASIKEKAKNDMGASVGSSLLTRIGNISFSKQKGSGKGLLPTLNIPEGQSLSIRLALGFLVLVFLLISPDESIQLILSLSTIGLFISQVKRGRPLFPSIGWSVVLLSVGLILGGIFGSGIVNLSSQSQALSSDKIEGLVAVVTIWIGSIVLD